MGQIQKILIVDDRKEVRKLIQLALRNGHYELLEATCGEQALEMIGWLRPDLVLLDILMPGGLDGFSVCRTLKENPDLAKIPVVIMTTMGQESDICEGKAAGADGYLVKPFSMTHLHQIVDQHLHKN